MAPKLVIVTHRKPHLDEVVASWLVETFDPTFKGCDYQFIANNPTGGEMPTGEQYVGLGVGRGKYDEHGLKVGHSATQLVFDDLMHRGLIPNDLHEDKALEWLVAYAHKEDTGQWETTDPAYTSFSIPAILRGRWLTTKDDHDSIAFGHQLIEAVMANLNARAKFLADWDKRIEFDSIWGKAVALSSTYKASDAFAYNEGFVLRIQKDPTKDYGDFRGPASSAVDLSTIYQKVESLEPGAWFLHQSKKILVASNDPASGLPTTKLSLSQLIDFVAR